VKLEIGTKNKNKTEEDNRGKKKNPLLLRLLKTMYKSPDSKKQSEKPKQQNSIFCHKSITADANLTSVRKASNPNSRRAPSRKTKLKRGQSWAAGAL
jgi:hypothetical protein